MRGDRGFTFIEILVALSIFSFGLLLFLQSSGALTLLHAKSRRMAQALILAEEQMEVLKSKGWDEAVSGCSFLSVPESGVTGLQKHIVREGVRFCLVFERRPVSSLLEHHRVTCYWKKGPGRFDRTRSVCLSTAGGS